MPPEIPSRLTSRFCHDLANPLGAIGNGLELLNLSGAPMTPELALVEESLAQANATLKLFRLAFGQATLDGLETTDHTGKLLTTWNPASRAQLGAPADLAISSGQAKMLCLTSMCIENALPGGGHIMINRGPEGFGLSGTGRVVKYDADLWAAVSDPSVSGPAQAAARLHFIMTGLIAQAMGAQITVTPSETQLDVTIRL